MALRINPETGHPVLKGKSSTDDRDDTSSNKYQRAQRCEEMDRKFGFERYMDPVERVGWLINMHPADVCDESKRLVSAVDFYFIEEDGGRFKVTLPYQPYFYIATKKGTEREVSSFLSKKLSGRLAGIDMVDKEDLDLHNHLVGLKGRFLKLRFHTVDDLMRAKRDVMPAVRRNRERAKAQSAYDPSLFSSLHAGEAPPAHSTVVDQMDNIVDIREYDVPYHVRVAIDCRINAGHWYKVKGHGIEAPEITLVDEQPDRPEPVVLAYDIETTKLPLKFPDSSSDMIMMISYMIDGQGYLLTNREVIGADVHDFEYTPNPEYEGPFHIFNETDEYSLLRRFLQHVLEAKPNIMVTYNGDFFDWPFVDARAQFHGMNLQDEIGFAPDSQNEYKCRPVIHMDAFRWVKRDSYLPVGSQNLKATTKAKLRYDPVELDPEEMCHLASEDPQSLANYSVSDAVATYYLYMKYVHPFIFALCTIIPMEPDEVLRKGSGTLCEALLMVQAFHGNIIFPNKQETALNKFTNDGHLLDSETYVGGHVEALESGVFRSDIPCHFQLSTDTLQFLADNVRRTMTNALEVEEKIPLDQVTNFDQVCQEVENKLLCLKEAPLRLERPMIYHLDVGAMYPNIILTNRLQPPAIVDEAACAACDFNKPGATCQRHMKWMWRGEYMPASRNEYQSIRLQLESEVVPGMRPSDPTRTFHQLLPHEQASMEKKRLADYCRKAYKRVRLTRGEIQTTTVCQKENSFYVDTVRAFRDRRYKFKGQLKLWKKRLESAKKTADAAQIKNCKNKEVLYDSLQLAHKCILNSFYGYVMRKGARWYSMEMAGIVCYTGASIITKAREIIEKIGRPLELDTDGIWCILPSSFPENFEFQTLNAKKSRVLVSYPGAMLNVMVQDQFTNHQYEELDDPERLVYTRRSENSIFFEVDGPYKAMILPAAKEEGKKLKKRYAVFNEDGTLAELKGFEVKRRGELQLVKNFQASVFETFLLGTTLQECFQSVATVADYWLDILYSKAENMPDSELFELISENRNMSRKLEDYGEQKSTSIRTAKRLAEFLGDQMVKDAGLSCRFIIARKPEGAPVTERAIPLAIFQAEPGVRRHYLRRWLKSPSLDDFDIRTILDWNYYIERLSSTIQKIITIPAAMQGVPNPVHRVAHPDWLHKRLLEKNDVARQQKISDMFSHQPHPSPAQSSGQRSIADIEGQGKKKGRQTCLPTITRHITSQLPSQPQRKSWRQVLGAPPTRGTSKDEYVQWLKFHKEKWRLQRAQRRERRRLLSQGMAGVGLSDAAPSQLSTINMAGFIRRRNRALAELPWQIIQIAESGIAGEFILWVLVENDLYQLRLSVPRLLFVNSHSNRDLSGDGTTHRNVSKILPRSIPVLQLCEYSIPEQVFQEHAGELATQLSAPDIEGVYESNIPLLFRTIVTLGCLCSVNRSYSRMILSGDMDHFELAQLDFRALAQFPYLEGDCLKTIHVYQSSSDSRSMFGIFFLATSRAYVFVLDRVRTNLMPNMDSLYQRERNGRISRFGDGYPLPPENVSFQVRVEVELRRVLRSIQHLLVEYRDLHKGPTAILLQTTIESSTLRQAVPALDHFPQIPIPVVDNDNSYPVLDWQRVVATKLINQFLNTPTWLHNQLEQARYSHVPVGNLPADSHLFVSDVFFSRHLIRHGHVLWASPVNRPDLGGHEEDDYRLMMSLEGEGKGVELNHPGLYPSVCVEVNLDGLAVSAVLKAPHINDFEGASGTSISLDHTPQASLEELMEVGGSKSSLTVYDEAALCSSTFKILRSMVHTWIHDVSTYQNYYADLQLQHFYRWMRSPGSLLHEPALCRIINKLMKKLFLQLVSEFQRLGSVIIFADYNRIILSTKKKSVEDACGYMEFILRSIQSRDLFHSIHLEAQACWSTLLWMNKANYGGIRCPIPSALQSMFGERESPERLEDEEKLEVEMKWNLAQFLPEAASCQEIFKVVIASHIQALHSHMVDQWQGHSPGTTPIRRRDKASQSQSLDNSMLASHVLFAQNRIESELSEKLFLITQKIQHTLTTGGIALQSNEVFPRLPGSHLRLINPALEFVKSVCQVLGLDSTTQHQVAKLRRDLLKLIGVREFAEEAVFRNPCRSFVLPEVICEACNNCRDIDLCRDLFTQYDEHSDRPMWCCSHCGTRYNIDLIEQSLLEAAQRMAMGLVTQDLVCLKCQGVKVNNMAKYCSCAGKFAATISPQHFRDQLITFMNIAQHFKMPLLEETVSWMTRSL